MAACRRARGSMGAHSRVLQVSVDPHGSRLVQDQTHLAREGVKESSALGFEEIVLEVDLRCQVIHTSYSTTPRNRNHISEASKRVPIFSFATQAGKQVSSYFRQRNWVQAREAQIRFPAG